MSESLNSKRLMPREPVMAALTTMPRWTAPMFPAGGGEDHLGLGSVSSDQILPTLSPTINVLTPHPRYHSFYAFLLDEFWRRDLPRSKRAWTAFFRPRDFLYSVSMHLCDRSEHDLVRGVTGSRKTSGIAGAKPPEFDTTTNYIKEPLGGYGLYYRSVLAGLGLIYPGGRGLPYPVDVPTEKGKEVAHAFRSAIEGTRYYKEFFSIDAARVPIAVAQEFARDACLCQLRAPTALDGPMLRDLFLHVPHDGAEARRSTFRMFLDIADQTDGYALDQDAFRQLLYFGETEGGAKYRPRDDLALTHRKWRLYQAREYYAFALTALWTHLCAWGIENNGDLQPIGLDAVHGHVEDALSFDELADALGVADPRLTAASSFESLLGWLSGLVGGDGEAFDAACGLGAPVNEHRLRGLAYNPGAGVGRVAGAITTLTLLHLRFGRPEMWLDRAWLDVSRRGQDGRLSIDRFMRSLRNRLAEASASIGEVAIWLLDDYVVAQHLVIATGKLPENTFRFEREGNRLRFYPHSNPLDFSDSRYEALATTVHELGYCESLTAADHDLSAAGRELLETGDAAR
jgi:hypothetical protein